MDKDTKDWTWVLERPCPDCGFDASAVSVADLPDLIHDNTRGWYDVLDRRDAAVRSRPDAWSALEYGCHVRDVHLVFAERLREMLQHDDPIFANWDQDDTAVAKAYADQSPDEVIVELIEAGAEVAAIYAGVPHDGWDRVGRRSNGSVFTVAGLGRYHLHDVVHHLWDVG